VSIGGEHDLAASLTSKALELSDHDLEVIPTREPGDMGDVDQDLSAAHDRNDRDMAESTNPVLRNPLMQLTAEYFQNCRITPDGSISVLDAIMYFRECSKDYAKRLWQEQSSSTKLCTTGILVEFHQFPGARQRKTPIAAFNVILRILALIPGPQGDALRKAQAELAARSISGDHDLQAALPVRREELGVDGQELAMTGISSSTDAQQKRQIEADEEVQQLKRRRLQYTTKQLTETCTQFYPGTIPLHPILIENIWDSAGRTMYEFLGLYKQMLELQHSQVSFNSEEARKTALGNAELSRTAAEISRAAALGDAELSRTTAEISRAAELGNAVLANEKARGIHVRDAEFERARLEAAKRNELAEREVADRKRKADRRTLHMGARKLAVSDVRRLLEAHFGDALTAPCGHQPCSNRVNAAKAWIVAKDDYTAGMDDLEQHARVVCPVHAKEGTEPVRHLYASSQRLVEMWLFRVGNSTRTVCAICGICPLRLWGEVEMCHVVPIASGGSSDEDNIILGSPGCNRQQSCEELENFAQRISAVSHPFLRNHQKSHLSAIRKELMSGSLQKVSRDAVYRMKMCVERLQKHARFRQPTI
jgi:hypothetical protein